jgi:hypothetical protein
MNPELLRIQPPNEFRHLSLGSPWLKAGDNDGDGNGPLELDGHALPMSKRSATAVRKDGEPFASQPPTMVVITSV